MARAWRAVGVTGRGPDCPLLRLRHYVLLEWPEFPIPDPGPLHVIAELKEPGTIPAIQVGVNISHPRRGDLQIRVPAGLTGG